MTTRNKSDYIAEAIITPDDRLVPVPLPYQHVFTFTNKTLDYQFTSVIPEADDDQSVLVISPDELAAYATTLPHADFLLADDPMADVVLKGPEKLLLAYDGEGNYHCHAYANGGELFVDGQRQDTYVARWTHGTQVLIGGLFLERVGEQIKWLALKVPFDLRSTKVSHVKPRALYPTNFPDYRRSPRLFLTTTDQKITIKLPDKPQRKKRGEILRTIVPPVGMIGAMFVTTSLSKGNPLMVFGMGIASLLTTGFTVSAYVNNRKDTRLEQQEKEQIFVNYLVKKTETLEQLAQKQRDVLNYHYPSIDKILRMVSQCDQRIYERLPTHDDFMTVSLGYGTVTPDYTITFNDEEIFFEREKEVAAVVEHYRRLDNLPITVPIHRRTIGLVGDGATLTPVVQRMLFELAFFHSYHDVNLLMLLSDSEYQDYWQSWRFLPHTNLRELTLRGIVHNPQSRDMVLNRFYQLLSKRRQAVKESNDKKVIFKPHYVMLIKDSSWLHDHSINEFLSEDMGQYGVTVIWCQSEKSLLPETTQTMITYRNTESGKLMIDNHVYQDKPFHPETVADSTLLGEAIRRIANLNHIEVEKNVIPSSVSFLTLYDVKTVDQLDILQRWQNADTSQTLAVPLGLRGRDDVLYLNLHERAHGPHGLVAGTTGSGKSETLQSYMLSLAVNFSPEDVGFLPIDFKGGGMANAFSGLPHLMGAITNLDGASAARALASIRAESEKRQRLFNDYGVNSISQYTKKYRQSKTAGGQEMAPLPHLFLISDEFAELKANQPEFMDELVSIARIGRSLGIHLILATQKPSGVVNDQIWSNSRFKLALKVQDVADSNEVLKTPDAASIREVGRGYLQVGNNEIYELFQSAWSGEKYLPDFEHADDITKRFWLVNQLGQSELVDLGESFGDVSRNETNDITELSAVVSHIANVTDQYTGKIPERPWLPPLPDLIAMPEVAHLEEWQQQRSLSVPVGLLDLPKQQAQELLEFDLSVTSHAAIFGSAGYGKTTFLQTLVMNLARYNSPDHVIFNLFDFGNNGLLPLQKLPHVADLVQLEQKDKLAKYIARVQKTLEERKQLFADQGVLNLEQYESKTQETLPVIVTVFDAYDAVRDDESENQVDTLVNQILREGASLGCYVLLSVLRENSLRMSMMSNMPTVVTLYMVDDLSTRSLLGREALAVEDVIGRGQIKVMGAPTAFQTFTPAEGTGLAMIEALEHAAATMRASWTGDCPQAIPMVPKTLLYDDFFSRAEVVDKLAQATLPIGLSLDTTEPVALDLRTPDLTMCIYDMVEQRDTMQAVVEESCRRRGCSVMLFDPLGEFIDNTTAYDYASHEESVVADFNNAKIALANHDIQQETVWIIADWTSFVSKTGLTADTLQDFVRAVKRAQVTVIAHVAKSRFDFDINGATQHIRRNLTVGVVGSRLVDQQYLPTTAKFNEKQLQEDETHFFSGRKAFRIKLPTA